jgi:hypothetical protein
MTGLSRIILRLGRNPEAGYPDGDDHYGYAIQAPVDAEGRLDAAAWRDLKEQCTVRRFHPDEPIADGWLRRRGDHWYFWYDEADEGPEEPVFKLGDHRLVRGEYVTITEPNGQKLTFRVSETNQA